MSNIEILKSLRIKHDLMIEAQEIYENQKAKSERITISDFVLVPGSHNSRANEDNAIKLINAEDLYFTRLNAYLDSYADSVKILESADLDPNQYSVLHGRYIQHKTFENIASDIGISTQWVFAVHSRALKKIEKVKIDE